MQQWCRNCSSAKMPIKVCDTDSQRRMFWGQKSRNLKSQQRVMETCVLKENGLFDPASCREEGKIRLYKYKRNSHLNVSEQRRCTNSKSNAWDFPNLQLSNAKRWQIYIIFLNIVHIGSLCLIFVTLSSKVVIRFVSQLSNITCRGHNLVLWSQTCIFVNMLVLIFGFCRPCLLEITFIYK